MKAMFDQYYFSLSLLNKILHNYFACTFYHFSCLSILEGGIIRMTKYDHDKYLSIATWGELGE